GGQGAPLAPFYHVALARKWQSDAPIAFVNIGGVANLTWIDPSKQSPDLDGACLAFDTGPGNALIDDLVFARTGERFDENGTLARSGTTDTDLLQKLFSENRYFSKIPPKSLDRDAFSDWAAAIAEKSLEDAAATLTAGTVRAITDGLDHCPKPPERLLVTGGGRKNPTLMAMLQDAVSLPVDTVEEVGFDGDMLEAQAFAYLAVRVLRGLPTSAPGTTGVAAPVGGGRVSRPGDLAKSQS
ncbi:MAG: anhydro-N-acetylmuramic acid kinase, partial [Boseongicola sp.]|nr:anhydro-N-acetylmuramic acid kinase [Boseongicola sp.]